jgi:hypothetical protein
MSNDRKKAAVEAGHEMSRRGLLESAAIVVGSAIAATAVSTSAFARTEDVQLDSSGRIVINGMAVGQSPEQLEAAKGHRASEQFAANRKPAKAGYGCANAGYCPTPRSSTSRRKK